MKTKATEPEGENAQDFIQDPGDELPLGDWVRVDPGFYVERDWEDE